MKHLIVVVGIIALSTAPAVAAAQGTIAVGGGGGGRSGDGDRPASGGTAVGIVDFAFQPAAHFADVGATVGWRNGGAEPHTVTSDEAGIDSGVIAPGEAHAATFDAAGVYPYRCAIHEHMTGVVVVR